MSIQEVKKLLNQYGYPCQNDASKDCLPTCPFFAVLGEKYAAGLAKRRRPVKDLEKLLKGRAEIRERLARATYEGVTFEDAATLTALELKARIVRQEIQEGNRRACLAYPEQPCPHKKSPRKST